MGEDLSYAPAGATSPGEERWLVRPAGFRAHESTIRIGRGEATWRAAADAVLHWAVKTRSGFVVSPTEEDGVRLGDYVVTARIGPLTVREPVRVVAVVDEPDRCGFAYGTLPGHPVSGEEAFVVHQSPDGSVWLTLRSLTRAPRGRWRIAFPVVLLAQRVYRRRYLRSLASAGS